MPRLLLLAALALAGPARADEPPDEPGVEAPPPPPQQQQPPPPLAPAPPSGEALPPPPPGYVYVREPRLVGYQKQRRWGLFALGCGIFGGAWVSDMIGALNDGRYLGLIPLAGPFLIYDDANGAGTNALLVLDGLAQAAGVTVAILGLTLTRKVPVYALVPTGRGLAVAGRF